MKNSTFSNKSNKSAIATSFKRPIKTPAPYCLLPMPSKWVSLLDPPTPHCDDEALLMCQYADGQWAAWIPDFGEVKLHSGQFCRMS
jgi:hypothetical protein